MNGRTLALIAILVIAVENSFVSAIAKKGLMEIPPLSLSALRFFVASLCVLPFFLQKKNMKFAHAKEITPISLFASINIIFYILGVNETTANIATIIYAGVPLLSGFLLYLLFRERLSKKEFVGVLFGFIGVLIIILLPLLEKGNASAGGLLGNIFLLFAITAWSFYLIYSKKLHKLYSPFVITSNFIFTTAILMIPFFLWDMKVHYGWWNHVTGWGIVAVLYFAIMVTIVGYILNQYALKHGGAVFASMTFYITPVLGFYVGQE
jgi:O-acetylserine/cysteine efflux transporter